MMVNLPCLMVSCTNFLRPTCSYTECQLSFLTGSCPTERTTVSYSSCLDLILTDLLLPSRKLIFSGRSPLFQRLVLLVMQCISHSIQIYGFPYPEPCWISDTLWNPARLWNIWFSLVLMPPVLTVRLVLLYLSTFSSDHMSSLLSGLQKSPSVSYRQSLSTTASFLADCLFGLCNTYVVL